MDIPRNPSNLPPIPERTSTPHVQHDTAPRGNNFHPDGRHGGTRDLDHGHAVRLFHGHDESYQGDRDPRLYARYEGVPAGRAGVVIGGCQVGVGVPPRSGTPSHNIALCRASAGSQSGSQWLTMARCAGLVGVERSCSRCIVSTRDSMLARTGFPTGARENPPPQIACGRRSRLSSNVHTSRHEKRRYRAYVEVLWVGLPARYLRGGNVRGRGLQKSRWRVRSVCIVPTHPDGQDCDILRYCALFSILNGALRLAMAHRPPDLVAIFRAVSNRVGVVWFGRTAVIIHERLYLVRCY